MLFIDRKHDFGRQQRSVQENDDVDAYERFRILSVLYGDWIEERQNALEEEDDLPFGYYNGYGNSDDDEDEDYDYYNDDEEEEDEEN